MAFFQGVLDRLVHVSISPVMLSMSTHLQHSLILLAMCVVCLLSGGDIVLKIRNGMLPCL
jgi:hypothetical protein